MMELFKLPAENDVNDTDNYQQNTRKSVINNYPAVSIENGSNLPDLSYINGDGNNTTSISTNISNLHNGNPILMDDDQNSIQGTTGSAAQPYSSGFGGLAVLDQQYFPTASLASSEFSDFSRFFL
ncbi:hypothetical protein TIFTF001_018522 [Ficus carica]|uniref:Uncharacterized protein n=1 Tax=Ficus carica TaxID=3494 RepID=A0AA88ANF4_FICCA|nr:hypothetical protein TIFTF001_018522 [Ficus carica]